MMLSAAAVCGNEAPEISKASAAMAIEEPDRVTFMPSSLLLPRALTYTDARWENGTPESNHQFSESITGFDDAVTELMKYLFSRRHIT